MASYDNLAEDSCVNDTTDGGVCTFRLVNGSCLVTLCSLGFLLSSFCLFNILSKRITLPGSKTIFLLNVTVSDVAISIVGIIRGLGIISKEFVGVSEDDEFGLWCRLYTLLGANFLAHSLLLALLPLTLDRFIAVVFARRHATWITRRTSIAMVVLSWLPMMVLLPYEIVAYNVGAMDIVYQPKYHRCVYENENDVVKAIKVVGLFYIAPLVLISVMYLVIVGFMVKHKIGLTRATAVSTAIISTGILVAIPESLVYLFSIDISYRAAQVLTVTLYYMNCVFDPVIYFCANPRVKKQMTEEWSQTAVKKQMTGESTQMSGAS